MSRPNPLKICVTGAAGQIAYSLLPLLTTGSVFGNDQKIVLHLLDITPALQAVSGVAMELTDGSYPLLESVVETDDPTVAFRDVDVAVLVGAFPRRAGMERKDLLAKNVAIFKDQGMALNEVASRNVKVLVVGNPANTNAMVIAKYAPKIGARNVSALTRLDHNRTLGQVAKRMGVAVDQVEGVCIWGNHSSTQYPDVMRVRVNGESVVEKLGGKKAVAESFIPTIQKRGAAVIKARGQSSAMSAARAIGDHLKSWILGDPAVISMAVASDGSYGIKEGVYFSFPVTCSGDGDYKIVQGIDLCEFSTKYIEATAAELYAEREEALALLD